MRLKGAVFPLTFAFFLASGVTWVAGDAGKGMSGRVTVADTVGLGIIVLTLMMSLLGRNGKIKLPIEYRAYLPLLFVFSIGVVFSRSPVLGALELLIHVFIFLVSVCLFNLFVRLPSDVSAEMALKGVLWAGAILAAVGLVDFLVWQGLIPGETNGLVGTFRNTGQAGAFFGMFVAILVPAVLSGIIKPSKIHILLLACIVAALVFTAKRAAVAGLSLGGLLLGLSMLASSSKRDKKVGLGMLVSLIILGPITYLVFMWGLDNVTGMAWRFGNKFSSDAIDDFSGGFLMRNIAVSVEAFSINPVVGIGLGNTGEVFPGSLEIHSTYLALLGNGGLLGCFAYIGFMGTHVIRVLRFSGSANVYSRYLRYYVPFLIGLILSWGYTYHLRKREFWILFFVVTLVTHLAARSRQQSLAEEA